MIGDCKHQEPLFIIPGSLRDLIPDDHILKQADRVLDLSWLRETVKDRYCLTNGRPSVPPECALRLMLAGFFLNLVHDRELLRQAQVNIAIRWFAGYGLHDRLPHHSTLSVIRDRWGEELFQEVLLRSVRQCVVAGLVSGETVHVDATLIRADVSWESLVKEYAEQAMAENPVPEEEPTPDPPAGQAVSGSKRRKAAKEKKRSKTDPEASMATSCRQKHLAPCFKQHTVVDDQAGVIVDVAVTTGETSEGLQLPEQLTRVTETLGRQPTTVTADSGYGHAANYQMCEARGIDAVIPPQRMGRRKHERLPARRFRYDAKHKRVRCPGKRVLQLVRENKQGQVFQAQASDCARCPLRARCFDATKQHARVIVITPGYEALLRARRRKAQGYDEDTRNSYRRHRWRSEGAHGEAKTRHGLGRAVRRGLVNVSIQASLTAAVMNWKRLARHAAAAILATWRRKWARFAPQPAPTRPSVGPTARTSASAAGSLRLAA